MDCQLKFCNLKLLTQTKLHGFLFPLSLKLLSTLGTIPSAIGFTFQPNTRPMKPLIGAIVVVASHHVAIAHVMAQAVSFVITAVFVVIGVSEHFIPIFAIRHGGPRP